MSLSSRALAADGTLSAGPAHTVTMLFLGGAHQLFHLAPVAAMLSRIATDTSVTCITADRHVAALLQEIGQVMDAPAMKIEIVRPPAWGETIATLIRRRSIAKLSVLWSLSRRIPSNSVIVTPERTSAWLRILHLTRAKLVHFRHGAGDRAPASERRLKAFDLIVVPGEKDVERAVHQQHIAPERLRVGGYVKLDYFRHHRPSAPKLFRNDRPLILFNPHFNRGLSAWGMTGEIIETIRSDGRYNLVVAPHIRIAENMDESERRRWMRLAERDRIRVDLDSDRLIDMTYVRQADIYLGDVSSQLYEFLATPRPAAFVNAHGVAWQDDPRYAGWHLGAVAETIDDLIPTLERAVLEHPALIARQHEAVHHAFGEIDGACARSARILIEALGA